MCVSLTSISLSYCCARKAKFMFSSVQESSELFLSKHWFDSSSGVQTIHHFGHQFSAIDNPRNIF